MHNHPVNDIRETKSKRLSGKKVVLGLTGSIAVVESVKLSHELIRHGAEVYPVLSPAACDIISPEALHYATGNEPILKLTGKIEHVSLCGQVPDHADILLIAPCTANTISKIAVGIDDTNVTTFATTAIGSKIPILIVPAMHSSMYEHPIIQENIRKLENSNIDVEFIEPKKLENKWKLASVDEIVSRVIRKLWKPDLEDKRILIISGATEEKIDEMRLLTNRSTGATGQALAKIAYYRGGTVELWQGRVTSEPPNYISTKYFRTVSDLQKMVLKLDSKLTKSKMKRSNPKNELPNNLFDIIIICAAISDYTISNKFQGKIPSGQQKLSLNLTPTPKIIEMIKKRCTKSYIVGFKAEAKLTDNEIIKKATQRLNKWKLDLIIANDLTEVSENSNQIYIIHPKRKPIKIKRKKELLSELIFDEIIKDKK